MQYPFTHAERTNFHFTPGPWNGVGRQGLPLKAMTPDQTKLAHALLATGVSQRGYIKATTIMSLEQILKELEAGGQYRSRSGQLFLLPSSGNRPKPDSGDSALKGTTSR